MVYGIYKDGKLKKTVKTENEAFMKLHKLQPFSVSHATRYEGWKIKKIIKKDKKKR